ncbi:MAG: mucin-binding protein [Bilifractor sp.]|jgi:hypothetical protein
MKRKELLRKLGIVLISGAMMMGSPAVSMVYAADNAPATTSTSEAGVLSTSNADAPAGTETPAADNNTGAEGAASSSSTSSSENAENAAQPVDKTQTDNKQEEAAENFSRTIHFIMEDGTDAQVPVDGKTADHIDEEAKDGAFASVKLPALEGYSAYIDGRVVDSVASAADASSAVKNVYVVYAKAGASAAKVSVTMDGDEVVSITAVGKSGDKYPAYTDKYIKPVVDSLKKAGYNAYIDSDSAKDETVYNADDYSFGTDGNIVVAMTSYDTYEEINSDNPKTEDDVMSNGKKYPAGLTKDDLERTWTRTIHYVKADDTKDDNTDNEEAAKPVTQKVTGRRAATVNHVTGEVKYEEWKITSDDKDFAEVKSPEVAGYTADKESVDKAEITKDTEKSTDVYVTYTADDQKAVIKFVDKDGNSVADSVTLTGKSGEIMGVAGKDGKKSLYSTKDAIKKLTDKGYKFVKDEFPKSAKDGGVFDMDKKTDQTYSVVLEPIVETVTSAAPKTSDTQMNANGDKYPAGLEKKDLEKTVTRTIHFVDKNKKKLKDDVVQVVTFTREAAVNHVTRKVTYGDWTSKNQSFALVEAPAFTQNFCVEIFVRAPAGRTTKAVGKHPTTFHQFWLLF